MGNSAADELKKDEAKLQMTPMIDVVFLLLIFFMTATKFQINEGAIKTFLPKDRGMNSTSPKVDLREIRLKLLFVDSTLREVRDKKLKDNPGNHTVLKIGQKYWPDTKYSIDYSTSPDFVQLVEFLKMRRDSYKGGKKDGLPVKIDARGLVPYKFIIRTINSCLDAGLTDITFAQPEIAY